MTLRLRFHSEDVLELRSPVLNLGWPNVCNVRKTWDLGCGLFCHGLGEALWVEQM